MPSPMQIARRSIWLGWLLDNPLLVREIRRRMRGRLFSWSLIGYLVALGAVSAVLMFSSYPWRVQYQSAREMIQQVGRIGSILFTGMCFVEAIIGLFIAPMLTAGLATAEKEKDTFDFLRVTTLHSSTFVIGCLLTTACFLLLVFSCTLPILGLTFIFGGVSMSEILIFNLTLFIAAMTISSWGIFNSTSYRRSRTVQGSIVVLFIIALFVFWNMGIFRRFSFGMGLVSANALFRYVGGVLLPLLLLLVIFAVMASRRLYDPNNRFFNYKQYTFLFLALLGAGAAGIAYWLRPGVSKPPDPDQIRSMLAIFFFAGWALNMVAIVFFSSGRIEKGDEVWILRVRRPLFQIADERFFLYGFYLLCWLGAVFLMGRRWDAGGEFLTQVTKSLPVLLLSLALIWSLTFGLTVFTENRNRVTIAVLLVLVLIWIILPVIGLALEEISTPGGRAPGELLRLAYETLMQFTPFTPVYWVFDGQAGHSHVPTLVILSSLILLSLSPMLSKRLRRRLRVSYAWTSEPLVSDGETEAEPAAI